MAEEQNGKGNIRINTAILIWLGGITISASFYAGISLERLSNLREQIVEKDKKQEEQFRLIDLRLNNSDSQLKAIQMVIKLPKEIK